MPIQYVTGDLLKSDCDVIGHQANCLKVMGAGIAKQIKLLYPEAYAADLAYPRTRRDRLGEFSRATVISKVTGKPLWIYNLYGQFSFGRSAVGPHTNYDALRSALLGMKKELPINNPNTAKLKIGFPRLGAGLAGGDWSVISKIIEGVFNDRTVFVYSF